MKAVATSRSVLLATAGVAISLAAGVLAASAPEAGPPALVALVALAMLIVYLDRAPGAVAALPVSLALGLALAAGAATALAAPLAVAGSLAGIATLWLIVGWRGLAGTLGVAKAVATVAVSIAAGAAAAFASALAVPATLAAATLAITVAAPAAGIVIGLAAIALPYPWSPSISGTVIAPAFLVSTVWGLAGILRIGLSNGGPLRTLRAAAPVPLDLAVALFCAAPLVSALATGGSLSLFGYFVANAAAPYFGIRLLVRSNRRLSGIAVRALLWIGLAVAAIALIEAAANANVGRLLANPDLARYTDVYERLGLPRVDSTIGQPIALGAFLLIPIAICLARRDRHWQLMLLLLLAAELFTFSRGPWLGLVILVAILGAVAYVGRDAELRWSATAALTAAAAAAALVVTVVVLIPPVREAVTGTFGDDTVAGNNLALRSDVLTGTVERLSVFGEPLPQAESLRLLPGEFDIASFFALTSLRTGLIGLALWLAIGALALRETLRVAAARDPNATAMAAAVMTQYLVLLTVSLITSYQHFFWISLALLASLSAAPVSSRRADATAAAR